MTSSDEVRSLLTGFTFIKVLSEDAKTRYAALLGFYMLTNGSKEDAILILEKTHFSTSFYQSIGNELGKGSVSRTTSLGSNDVYKWLLGWMPDLSPSGGDKDAVDADAHVKMTIIRPATEAHIAKYTEQQKVMIKETPELYESVVLPWIQSQPIERIQWVYNILDKKKEADTILYEKSGSEGFIIVPDLKWDQKTLSSLYLIAIVHDRSLRSIRDLTKQHISMLEDIREQGEKLARVKYNLADTKTGLGRITYCHAFAITSHLHVHLLSSDYVSHPGAIVGQAHLLEDVIDLLHLGVDFRKRTFTYSLGERSQLLQEIQLKTGKA